MIRTGKDTPSHHECVCPDCGVRLGSGSPPALSETEPAMSEGLYSTLRIPVPDAVARWSKYVAKRRTVQWADADWNAWLGCTPVSPACACCYAEPLAQRKSVKWGKAAARRRNGESTWRKPVQWNNRARKEGRRMKIFSASMSDVFENHDDLPPWRRDLWKLIGETPHLDWMLLTKRPENIMSMVPWKGRFPANVWIGTTVEDQKRAKERLPILRTIPAIVRFVSAEPLLEEVDFEPWIQDVDWIITGGESGPRARPTDIEWIRRVRDVCIRSETRFFFKQWGKHVPDDLVQLRRKGTGAKKKAKALPELDGWRWDERPSPDREAWCRAV